MTRIETFIVAFHHMKDVKWENNNNSISGIFLVTVDSLDILHRLVTFEAVEEARIERKTWNDSELISATVGQEFTLLLSLPRTENHIFALNLEDMLIRLPKLRFSLAETFFLAEENYEHGKSHAPVLVEHYLDIVRFIKILESISDYIDERNGNLKLVFFKSEKLEININYLPNKLPKLSNLAIFEESFRETIYVSQKKLMALNALFSVIGQEDKENRFSYLLNHFETFYIKYQENYKLFLSEFTFDKIKEEIDNRILDTLTRINKIISDIQDKLLAIPAALLFSASQMKKVITPGDFLVNLIIVIAVLIFADFMFRFIKNQKDTLVAVNSEYNLRRKSYEEKYKDIYESIKTDFDKLDERYRNQLGIVSIVNFSVRLTIFATVVLYISRFFF